jgi:hypothetical protein
MAVLFVAWYSSYAGRVYLAKSEGQQEESVVDGWATECSLRFGFDGCWVLGFLIGSWVMGCALIAHGAQDLLTTNLLPCWSLSNQSDKQLPSAMQTQPIRPEILLVPPGSSSSLNHTTCPVLYESAIAFAIQPPMETTIKIVTLSLMRQHDL